VRGCRDQKDRSPVPPGFLETAFQGSKPLDAGRCRQVGAIAAARRLAVGRRGRRATSIPLRRRTIAITVGRASAITIFVRRRPAAITVSTRSLAIVAVTPVSWLGTSRASPFHCLKFSPLILGQDFEKLVSDLFLQIMQFPLLLIGEMDLSENGWRNQDAQPPNGWAAATRVVTLYAATALGLLIPEPALTSPRRFRRFQWLSRGPISPGDQDYDRHDCRQKPLHRYLLFGGGSRSRCLFDGPQRGQSSECNLKPTLRNEKPLWKAGLGKKDLRYCSRRARKNDRHGIIMMVVAFRESGMLPIDPMLLGRLYRQHAPALLLDARQWADGAEDVVQDAFVRLAQQKPQPANVVPWLYRVIRNQAFANRRRDARRRRREALTVQACPGFPPWTINWTPCLATRHLAELPLEVSEVMVARLWGGLTFAEVAKLVGCSLPTAQRRDQIKARVEIAQSDYGAAANTLQSGLAFSRHVAEGPFLIHGLIAITIDGQLTDAQLDWVGRPDAPNLYWSITVLPKPLIDLRKEMDYEQRMEEMQFPDLADLKRERCPSEWDATLTRLRAEFEREIEINRESPGYKKDLLTGSASTDPANRSQELPAARRYLIEQVQLAATKVEKMSPAQLLVLYEAMSTKSTGMIGSKRLTCRYRKHCLSLKRPKSGYIPHQLPRPWRFPARFIRQLEKLCLQQTECSVKLPPCASSRLCDSTRPPHDGRLADKLREISEVPIPDDPGTGKPFQYVCEGRVATLTAPLLATPYHRSGQRYRLTMKAGK